MDYVGFTLLNANSWHLLNGKKGKEQHIFSNMFKMQHNLMIQAENNNISLTEFSNVSRHFMEDVNTPQIDFSFS